jgi:DNA repair protein RecN (Recombination protein N)
VASAALRLEKGLTVITGESGAGKSSLVRSLELLGGKRSQSAFLRSGEEEGSVEAVLSGFSGDRAGSAYAGTDDGFVLLPGEPFRETDETRRSFRTGPFPFPLFPR